MNAIRQKVKHSPNLVFGLGKRFFSTAEIEQYRSEYFIEEQRRQKGDIGRIEKMEVRFLGLPKDVTLIMNKGLSTPYNVAQHLSEMHCKTSALALVDSTQVWDMHRPLQESCTLQLLNFTISEPHIVNKAFWRSCSFMLGAALTEAFKDEAGLLLHSFPSPNIRTGSFVHDISIHEQNWSPTKRELRAISAEMIKLSGRQLIIERLEVNHGLAMEMFKDNPYKVEQLPSISRNGSVTLYKVGNHVDISRGPMIAHTGLLGKCTISAAHKIVDQTDNRSLYRIQGVALPTGFIVNHFAYAILEDRSREKNPAHLPHESYSEHQSAESVIA